MKRYIPIVMLTVFLFTENVKSVKREGSSKKIRFISDTISKYKSKKIINTPLVILSKLCQKESQGDQQRSEDLGDRAKHSMHNGDSEQ